MKIRNLGWILAAGMGAPLLISGFRTQATKVGVVDLQTVFQQSDYYMQKEGDLKAMGDGRSDILNFLNTYPTITVEQAQRLKALSLKPELNAAEKAELNKLKTDVQAGEQAFKALQMKKNPTAEEIAKLNAFNNQRQQTGNLYNAWTQEFTGDINMQKSKFRQEVLERVKSAVGDCGKKQSYNLVFASDVAPFGANDVTAEALKVMNAKK
jgi:Skp family chaperone for outer membrane proteins